MPSSQPNYVSETRVNSNGVPVKGVCRYHNLRLVSVLPGFAEQMFNSSSSSQ